VLQEVPSKGYVATVHQLLENGADIEAKSGNGELVMISAPVSGNEAILLTVLEFGVDINSRNGPNIPHWTGQHLLGASQKYAFCLRRARISTPRIRMARQLFT
jgi:hypothetical protein